VDTPKSHVEAPGWDGRVVSIAFVFQDAERDFPDAEIGSPENDRANARGLFHRIRCPADPVPLLSISGATEVFIVFEPAMFPSMRAELMPTPVTFMHQVGVHFGETSGEEDGARDSITGAQFQ
jgi:hypothetical protein